MNVQQSPSFINLGDKQIQLGKLLGKGSFGAVYEANWAHIPVAIKVLRLDNPTQRDQDEFLREMRIMKELRHINLIRVYECGTIPSNLCIIMEKMGGSLHAFLHSESEIDWKLRYDIARGTSAGLSYLHNQSSPITHRDLKSLNILLDPNLQPKITDFGLSVVKTQTAYMTSQGGDAVVGTPQWMAPELILESDQPRYSRKSDIYSLGVVFWELATRKMPYEGLTLMGVLAQKMVKRFPEIPNDLNPNFRQMIVDCLKDNPDDRPVADVCVQRLDALIQQERYSLPPPFASPSPSAAAAAAAAVPAADPLRPAPALFFKAGSQESPEAISPSSALTRPLLPAVPNKAVLVPELAFGASAWKKFFGDVGAEPPLPANIHEILKMPCPFFPSKKISDTHVLALVPATINQVPFTLNVLGRLVTAPKQGSRKTQYFHESGPLLRLCGDKKVDKSYWILMAKQVLESTRNKMFAEQSALAVQYTGYHVPTLLEAATAIFTHYLMTGERIYSVESASYTRCTDQIEGCQTLIGFFDAEGLKIGSDPKNPAEQPRSRRGLGLLQRF